VTREAGGAVTLLVGAITLRLALTGDFKRYVRPGMGPLLVAAGVVLVGVGLAVVVQSMRRRPARSDAGSHDHAAHESHDDHEPERVGWLVLAPVLAVLLVAPPALGAFAVDRVSRVRVTTGELFQPLAAEAEPHPMSLLEFMQRAADRDGASLSTTTIELTGFVAGEGPSGFDLARYSIACCAADAAVAVVAVVPESRIGLVPDRDEWVRVIGTYESGSEAPTIRAVSIEVVPPPDDPYE
jgi:uncharacterized repeat protein (TIGR03943 family)